MRPIRLTLNAFGPFAGKEVVDFTAALDAGIFGIYGDTGSGKTTIFDGIAFALFGQSSGAERVSDDMLSHYADPKEITYVELVFDLGEKRYVIRRIPRQERAASRGEGLASQAHEVYLFDATGLTLDQITQKNSGDMLAEKKTSLVDPMIKDLLGYDAAQFRQIVLLPQGEFRKILTASSDERSPILKRLFDVSLYENFMQKIRTQASTLRQQIRDERLRKETILDGVTEGELKEDIASSKITSDELEGKLTVLNARAKFHQRSMSAAETLIAKFTSLEDAQEDRDQLDLGAPIIKVLKARVAQARAAQLVLPAETLRDRAAQQFTDASKQKTDADSALGAAKTIHETAKTNLQRVSEQKPAHDAAITEVQKLGRWKEVLDKAASLQQPVSAAREALDTARMSESEATDLAAATLKKLQDLQALQKALPVHTKATSDATTDLAKLDQETELAIRYESSVLKLDQQVSRIEVLRDNHQKAASHLRECKDAFTRAEKALTDIQALHVARKLVPDEPCPACGSREHPHPATGDPERMGRHEAFEATEEAHNQALGTERETRGLLASGDAILVDRQQELDAMAKPVRSRETLAPLLNEARNMKETLENDVRFNDLAVRLAAAEDLHKTKETIRIGASEEVARKKEAKSNAQTALTTTLQEVPEKWRDAEDLDSEYLAKTAEVANLEQQKTSATEAEKTAALRLASANEAQRNAASGLTRTTTASMEAAEAFLQSLENSKLSGDDFQAAKSDVHKLGEMEGTIQTHNSEVASNTDRLKRLAEDIGEQERPDLETLQAAAKASADLLETSRADQTRLTAELERKNKVFASITTLSAKILGFEKKFEPLGEIANLVNGDNDLKVRLPDFAIAAMFDEILDAANLRLGPMTNHRYQLHRPIEKTGGRTKRGLDIAVFDANTEKSRSTTSLSGGEGFQASLALALGLSDVVQQNSGGIKLDAIFIDEGFGTLDQETLDTALDTLCSLVGEKRAVCLISHTEQVKILITEGFDIEVAPGGSHIHARKNVA
ncbi:hypothetical protein A9Q96_09615 [Rhodobacterales bacterium 52_120_T64]|nr:hypothetical protein A9Q96_09615 [Rhodobacterales bacterium 52_120_T64]